jgi:hypothetical protein
MATIHKALMALAIALALGLVVTAGASPALAKGRAQASYNGGGYPITAARAAALRACTAREAQYPDYLWGVTEIQIYRSCMAEHGQPE